MRDGQKVALILPAMGTGEEIGVALSAVPDWVDQRVVVDDGASEMVGFLARRHGARIVHESLPGYGAACLAGASVIDDADVVIFADAADDIDALPTLVDALSTGKAAVVYGRRAGRKSSLDDALSSLLFGLIWNVQVRRVGTLVAVRRDVLKRLALSEVGRAVVCQMLVRALQAGVVVAGIDVNGVGRRNGGSTVGLWVQLSGEFVRKSLGVSDVGRRRDRLVVLANPPCGEQHDEQAQTWQNEMIRHAVNLSRQCAAVAGVDVATRKGQSADLARCLDDIRRTVFIDAACPELSTRAIYDAFAALKRRNVVIGPRTRRRGVPVGRSTSIASINRA